MNSLLLDIKDMLNKKKNYKMDLKIIKLKILKCIMI